ncbi:MAG: hypothetical protein M5R40_20370 [Anaerolineae bacterium]|nr:hypothetical protein [Anaerolineae bacterium]
MDTTLRDSDPENHRRPHLILLVPRGEAVRNFLYSDTLPLLSENARVTLLSVIHDAHFRERFEPHVDAILPLKHYPASQATNYIHMLVHEAHFDWLGSQVAENRWEVRLHGARTPMGRVKVRLERAFLGLFANRQIIEALVKLERRLHLLSPGADAFHKLFSELKPDLVFNTSHIHGQEAHLPVKVAHDMGIPTVGFIFSWDNLTSRSRIFEPYDYYLVWHQKMRDQLVSIYPNIQPENVLVTGTPQFDFHFKPEYWLAREALCQRIGVDPSRPFVLYTAGIDRHFPEEHRTVELIIRLLREMDVTPQTATGRAHLHQGHQPGDGGSIRA